MYVNTRQLDAVYVFGLEASVVPSAYAKFGVVAEFDATNGVNPMPFNKLSVSTNLISPPSACVITILFCASTVALTLVTPAEVIAFAINIASALALPVVPGTVTVTGVVIATLPVSLADIVNVFVTPLESPGAAAVTAALRIVVAPLFCLR